MSNMKVLVSTNILPVDIRDIPSIMKGDKGDKGTDGRDGSYVQKAYKTYAGMVADKDSIPTDSNVVVNNDPDKDKNAYYTYDGTEFTKSDFDPQGILSTVDVRLNQAVESASEYFQSQVADTVDTAVATSIDNSTVAYNQAIEVTKGEWADTLSTTNADIKANSETYLATIPGTVNDAINNTAVEGGVLADTFVTVTANAAGSIPRTLRSKNSDRQYLTDFGNYGDDGDWTPAFHAAAATGKTTWLPDGNYKLRTDALDCQGRDLIFKSDNAVVTLIYGVGNAAFDITDCNKVEMTGVTFKVAEGLLSVQRRLFVCTPTSLVGELNVSHCKFRNNIVLIRTNGTTTQNPELTPYGFKRFIFNDNRLDNINYVFTLLNDYPIYHGEIKRNTVNNFSNVLMYFGGSVGGDIGTAILDITKFFIEDNIVTTDDDFWNNDAASGYHCFALVEGSQATWLRNNISGMKTKSESVSIYDAYLSVQTLTSEGNTYKNIANFNPAYGKLTHLMKSKKRSTAERPCVKVVKNNKYIIEDEWMRRIGETECSHQLFGLGDGNGGDVTVTDNYISIHTLQNQGFSVFDKLFFINNTVRAKKLISSSAPGGNFRFLEIRPYDERGELAVIDNKFYIEDMQTNVNVISFINGASGEISIWNRLTVLRNTLDAGVRNSVGVRFIDKVRSLNTKVSGNLCATNTQGLFTDCELGNITGTSNTINRTLGVYNPIQRTLIYGSGVIEQSGVGRISGMSLTAPFNPNMSYTQYVVSVEVITIAGKQTIEFSYQLQVIDGIPKIKFRTPTNSLKTVTINSTEETGTEIKSVFTGVDTPILSAKLLNTLTNTEVVIEGLPANSVPFKVSLSTY